MTEEIKGILDILNKVKDYDDKEYYISCCENEYLLANDEIKCLLNYITNLQKENNSLKGNIKRYAKKVKNQRVEIDGLLKQRDKIKIRHIYLKKDLKDYKSRNEKAVEYIEKCRNYHRDIHNEEKIFPDEIASLLMILKGGDE